jgi:hypothetical protein
VHDLTHEESLTEASPDRRRPGEPLGDCSPCLEARKRE